MNDAKRELTYRTLYISPSLTVARIIVPPSSRNWGSLSSALPAPEMAFPRLPVVNIVGGHGPILRGPTSVNLLNTDTRFRRRIVHPDGVLTDWFSMPPEVWNALLEPLDPEQADDSGQPFRYPSGPLPASAHSMQRGLSAYLDSASPSEVDPIFVEETALAIAGQSLHATYKARRVPTQLRQMQASERHGRTNRVHREAVQHSLELLALRLHERITLEDIGTAVSISPLHFCRIFKNHTGQTIHAHLTELRARAAFDHLCNRRWDLTELALETGFSNRSHLSRRIQSEFGRTAREIRNTFSSGDPARLRELAEMSA